MTVGDGGEARLAPVIPLFGDKVAPASALPHQPSHGPSHEAAAVNERSEVLHRSEVAVAGEQPPERDPDQIRATGEESLLRKLRARSLSISEARQVLRGHDLDLSQIDDAVDDFCRRGYLDDLILAEQLVISGIERKGQGRVALSRALAQRGIPRDVIDTALGDLPDDDAERALEFARTKARSMTRLDFETALRRLMGQLARRGYGGSVAMNAARTALTETSLGKPTSGVRFVDSE
ncbi:MULTISPECIES: regulatory protein RecX [Microbacterium]|uniref:regulatory protein RecX n=1 Tax=Microbacterium TaxID=33882 RepID=UPI00051A1DA4|nr:MULTISPECIES: regulatory protein RecX [Microbacterium]MCE7480525.1 RecX family transcriptional regulator [Microbacterium profundi]